MLRDASPLRERVVLSLDDRQVAAFAVGALLLLAGMFALGLLVGMQVARRSAPPRNVGKYTVQLGATQSRTDALQLASRSSAAGLKAYVAEARLPGKGVW